MSSFAFAADTPEIADREFLLSTVATSLETVDQSGELVAVIVLKLQRLKAISIEYGYSESDELVALFVDRLKSCLREKDTLAQLRHDEYALVLPELKNPAQPLMAINKIQRACSEPIEIDGRSLKMQLTFGTSIGPDDAGQAEDLLRCADLALNETEISGVDSIRYSASIGEHGQPQLQIESDLQSAIRDGILKSCYEPIVDVETGELVGVEMLTRWPRESSDDVASSTVIDIAERSGLIMPLTLWCLNNGLRECGDWQAELPSVPVSINFSPLVLTDPHLPDVVHSALNLWGANLGDLTVEVSETTLMSDPDACLAILNQLHSHGVSIAIDDFGTGYSSLAYLKNLPIDILKIDRSFVTNMLENQADRRIVQTVIDLAHNFDLTVVAEGVEDEETLDTLMLMGCQRAQGGQVGNAMPCGDLAAWFEESPWDPISSED